MLRTDAQLVEDGEGVVEVQHRADDDDETAGGVADRVAQRRDGAQDQERKLVVGVVQKHVAQQHPQQLWRP